MKDSLKVEAALREGFARKPKPEDKGKVDFDHDRSADGTSIHRIILDPKNFKLEEVGEPLMFLAFPNGSAVAAVGENGLAVLKRALATLKEPAAASAPAGPQIGFDFSALRFSRLRNVENEVAFREAAHEAFPDPEKARDRIRIGLTGESARLRLLMEADLPVVRFLVKVGVIQQKAKAAKAP